MVASFTVTEKTDTKSPCRILRIIQNHYNVPPVQKSESQLRREKWLLPGVPFNRWFLLPAAVLIQFCCGSLYSWSVFNKPIELLIYGESRNVAPIAFYMAVGGLGLAAALMGPVLEKRGPMLSCFLGTSLFFCGNLLTALALHLRIMWLVLLGYGLVAGFGIGICYISPVSALQKWFPDMRGLAAGFAVCGFGAGSIVIAKAQLPLMGSVGLPLTFVVLGSAYFSIMMVCGCVLRTPPPGYMQAPPKEAADEEQSQSDEDGSSSQPRLLWTCSSTWPPDRDYTLIEALTSRDFRAMMLMFAANIIFGLVLVSRLSNIVTDVFGRSPEEAATAVSINGGFNLAGRLGVANLSDRFGRKNAFSVMLTLQIAILGIFSVLTSYGLYWPFLGCMWTLTACYGAGFGVIPAFLTDKFGAGNTGACHGIILTGWSFAGIGGGLIFTAVFDALIAGGSKASDPYPYNVNVWWIFGLVCLGWIALQFVAPLKKDIIFKPKPGTGERNCC